MALRIVGARLRRLDLSTRLPFRYGMVTVTSLPHALLELDVAVDGTQHTGVSADHLAPKWFAKNPDTSPHDDIASMETQLKDCLRDAVGRDSESAFTLWKELYDSAMRRATAENIPPLLAHFPVTLIERALLHAVCRAKQTTLADLVHSQSLGFPADAARPEHATVPLADAIPNTPIPSMILRHTVGFGDPLESADGPGDSLPRTLVEYATRSRIRHYKIKVCGDPDADVARLDAVLSTLETHAPRDFQFTLDGNESYSEIATLRAFWSEFSRRRPNALPRLLFFEQPLHRDLALSNPVGDAFSDWPDRPKIIIDESDATLESFPRALNLGYAGTSHKNCKGVFKGLANACLARKHGAILSGEDLSCIGPISLQQDLVVQSLLGIESVERNGHHYFAGLSGFPTDIQRQIIERDSLYEPSPEGFPTLRISGGAVDVAALHERPFGVIESLDLSQIPEIFSCG